MAKNVTNWDEILSEYKNRDCSQKEFCSQRGISAGTLSYQLTIRNKAKKTPQGFIPLSLSSPSELQEVRLEFPSGIRLSIRG